MPFKDYQTVPLDRSFFAIDYGVEARLRLAASALGVSSILVWGAALWTYQQRTGEPLFLLGLIIAGN